MSSNLWVGNLAADVSDSELRNLFEKHGCVDSVACYPSRNYAFIHFKGAEDAKRARHNLQGVVLRGNPLKIDFAKPAKPCKSLWVSGISTSISKEDLEKEFSKFGKIEDFKFHSDKKAAYVDYYRLEDACKAHKAMHDKQKGETLVRVDYLRSHPRRHILPSEGLKVGENQPSKVLLISYPPTVRVDEQMLHNAMILFGEIEKITSFPSRFCSFVEFRSMEEALLAKEGLQGKLFSDPRISITFSTNGPTLDQHSNGFHHRPDASFNKIPINSFHGNVVPLPHGVGGPITTSNGILSSPSENMNPSIKRNWDAYEIQRDPKRLRTDNNNNNNTMPLKVSNDWDLVNEQVSKRGIPQIKGVGPTNPSGNPEIVRPPRVDYVWRGIIAKGGINVCHARCVPIEGDWNGYEIPEVVNCSARTGLDMLSKHCADAVGFDMVFFLPDNEEDFASYTEFLRYLRDHNRAGVVKFVDGTTLFLVPPSEFLTSVLNVSGPERLYGVVLKFPVPQHISSGPTPQTNHGVTVSHEHQRSENPVTLGGVSLTPELISSLASLAKINTQSNSVASDERGTSNFAQAGSTYQSQAYLSNTVSVIKQENGVCLNLPQFEVESQQYQNSCSGQVYEYDNGQQYQMLDPDADKNERYQSTLKFAASLLLQIHQKRPVENAQFRQG